MSEAAELKITIGFLSDVPVTDKKAWSGTVWKLYESIGRQFDVLYIPVRKSWLCGILEKTFRKFAEFSGKHCTHLDFVSRSFAKHVDRSLMEKVDLLFARESMVIAHLRTEKPVIYFSDATFDALYGYYPSYSNLFSFNIRQARTIERLSLEKCSCFIASSDWAAESAIRDYGVPESKVRVLEFGPNIDEKDLTVSSRINGDALNILFSGVDWVRKGGDVAVECCECLNDMGIRSILHIVGIRDLPPEYSSKDFIVNYGFLNKNEEAEYRKYVEILKLADIFLLPTNAECSAIVLCEASAMKVPAFTYDTGGVGNYVKSGVNGYRLAPGSSGKQFAEKIAEVLRSGELDSLKAGCETMYRGKLNWSRWSDGFRDIVAEMQTN